MVLSVESYFSFINIGANNIIQCLSKRNNNKQKNIRLKKYRYLSTSTPLILEKNKCLHNVQIIIGRYSNITKYIKAKLLRFIIV